MLLRLFLHHSRRFTPSPTPSVFHFFPFPSKTVSSSSSSTHLFLHRLRLRLQLRTVNQSCSWNILAGLQQRWSRVNSRCEPLLLLLTVVSGRGKVEVKNTPLQEAPIGSLGEGSRRVGGCEFRPHPPVPLRNSSSARLPVASGPPSCAARRPQLVHFQ